MQYAKLALEIPISAYVAHIETKTTPKVNNSPSFLFDLGIMSNTINKKTIHNTNTYNSLKSKGVTVVIAINNMANIGVKL